MPLGATRIDASARRGRTLRWIVAATAPLLAVIVFGIFPARQPDVLHYPRFQLGVGVLVALVLAALLSRNPKRLDLASLLTVVPLAVAPVVALLTDYEPTARGLFPFFMLIVTYFVGYLLLRPAALALVVFVSVGIVALRLAVVLHQPIEIVGIPLAFVGILGTLTTVGSIFRTRDEAELSAQASVLAEQKAALEAANSDLEREVTTRTAELSSSLAWLREEMAEHERARSALSATRDILTTLFTHLRGMTYRRKHDAAWTYLFVSSGAAALLERADTSELEPAQCDLGSRIPAEHLARVRAELELAARVGGTYSVVYPIVTPNHLRWVRDQGQFVTDESGEVLLEGLVLDITRERELEAELHAAQRLEAVGRVAGGIAHDFNNLMTVVVSYVDLLLQDGTKTRDGSSTRYTDDLHEIRLAADRAQSLTKQLLAFSRKQVIEPKAVWLTDVLDSMATMLRQLVGPQVELAYELERNDWPVMGDPTLLEQVILNLVVNAGEAMDGKGAIVVRTRNLEASPATPSTAGNVRAVEWTIADNGPGMSTKTRERAFEPFFSTKEATGGTGLGLATVYGIVKQLGGEITLETAPGQGCSFRIVLPATVAESAVRPSRLPPPRSVQGNDGGDETILVVDDERPVRSALKRILDRAGYHVLIASGPSEAMRISREYAGPIHLLLTDVIMPEGTGTELAAQLTRERNDMRVLFVSGYSGPHLEDERLPAQRHLLEKPFTAPGLRSQVRAVLDT